MRLPASHDGDELGINLTPVIDVVFLLLIFFLVASRFDKEEREEKLALPEVTEAQPITYPKNLVINVTSSGKYIIMGKEYSEKALASRLKQERAINPHQTVLIRGDGNSAWRFGVRAVSLCRAADIKDCRVAVLEE